jgi:hypothetical protein
MARPWAAVWRNSTGLKGGSHEQALPPLSDQRCIIAMCDMFDRVIVVAVNVKSVA